MPKHKKQIVKTSAVILLTFGWLTVAMAKVNVHELRCEVCQRTVEEMEKDVNQVDPNKKIHVGEFMLDHKGDRPEKKVELRRSEIYLTELMERVCKKMDDYVRAIMRDSGKLVVIPLVIDGMMNSIIGDAHIIQDGDLNRSLKFYCENIVEEYDEGFVKYFGLRDAELSDKICWEYSKLCKDVYPAEYEEDIVAAEKKKNRKFKMRRPVSPNKPIAEMNEQERQMDQLSRLPIHVPGMEEEYEEEEGTRTEENLDSNGHDKQEKIETDQAESRVKEEL